MRFLDRPIDLKALRAVLGTMSQAASKSDAAFIVLELEILVEEAQRAFNPAPWEDRIIDRWKAGGAQGFFTYTWNCCGDPETLANHPELWDTWRRENTG